MFAVGLGLGQRRGDERLAVGLGMIASILLALLAVRRRDFAVHGAWMIRAYALGMGAGTQVFTQLPWMLLVGPLDPASKAALMAAGWLINIAVAEAVIARSRRPRPGRPWPGPASARRGSCTG